MRRIIIAIRNAALAISLVVGLGGCAALKEFQNVATIATANVQNPVTPKMLYQAEQGLVAVVSVLQVYKNACARQTIPPSCREVIAEIQVYTTQAAPLIVRLRAFVRQNDQINAVRVYNAVQGLLTQINASRATHGV